MKPLFPRFFRLLGIVIGGSINLLLVWVFPTPFHYIPMFLLALCGISFLRELIKPRHESMTEDVVDKMRG